MAKHRRRIADMSLPPDKRRSKPGTGLRRKKSVPAQMDHGSCPAGTRKAREGEERMERERRPS
jgi:hypothetical protein